jgi:hypothetical protein
MSDTKGIVVNFEEAKRGLEIPKSPQYKAFTRIRQILDEENCILMINTGLEQVGPNVYRIYAEPTIKEKPEVQDNGGL